MSMVTEARLMNIREFRAVVGTVGEQVVVLSKGKIIGCWIPGTDGIATDTLAAVMGLTSILEAPQIRNEIVERRERAEDAAAGFHPVPKPSQRKRR